MHKRSILKVPRRNKKIASGFLCFVVEEKGGVKTSEIQLPPKKKKNSTSITYLMKIVLELEVMDSTGT